MAASVGSEREGLKGFCPSVMIWNSHGFDLTLIFRLLGKPCVSFRINVFIGQL
jgi:hypothetical protein